MIIVQPSDLVFSKLRVSDIDRLKTVDMDDIPAGFIFGCTLRTESECRRKRLFGLPPGRISAVEKVAPGTPLFLYNYDLRVLYGVFEATSQGGWSLEDDAWAGCFPAQIRVKGIATHQKRGECLLKEDFSDAIRDNFFTGQKFSYALSEGQVRKLEKLFRSSGWSPNYTPKWNCLKDFQATKGIQKRKMRSVRSRPMDIVRTGRLFGRVRQKRVIARGCPIRYQTPPTRRFLRDRSTSVRRSDVMDYEMEVSSVDRMPMPMGSSRPSVKTETASRSKIESGEAGGDRPIDATSKGAGDVEEGEVVPRGAKRTEEAMSPQVTPQLNRVC